MPFSYLPCANILCLPLIPLPQGAPEDELPWTLQHSLTQLRMESGHQMVGSAICASRVKLQHLPSQVRGQVGVGQYPGVGGDGGTG